MSFRKAGDTKAEMIAELFTNGGDEFRTVTEIIGSGNPLGLIFGRIAAQGQDIAYPAGVDIGDNRADFVPGV